MKKICIFLLPFLCVSLLSAQSLYELAQKERARRAKNKGKKVRVVTNADLLKATRRQAVTVKSAPASPQAGTPGTPQAKTPGTPQDRGGASENPRVIVTQDSQGRDTPSQADRRQPRGGTLRYATKALPETQNVENPDLAVGPPDGQYAMINYLGFIDLEFSVSNGAGDDIVVHARRQDEGSPMPNLNYFVYVMPVRGDWEAIGMGTGTGGAERFDLGEIRAIDRIRIVYRELTRRSLEGALYGTGEQSIMKIDAVEALR
jgi:hypothetical protein